MARKGQTKRKDKDRIVLKKGECQRANGTYHYCWTDGSGKRHFIYAPTLEELREKEAAIPTLRERLHQMLHQRQRRKVRKRAASVQHNSGRMM